MTLHRRLTLAALIALILIADQATKHAVRTSLAMHEPMRYFGVATLIYTENPGAFLSLGESLPPKLRTLIFDGVVAIGLAIAVVALFLGRIPQRGGDDVALALIVAGGVGNLIDRVRFHGRVTDFIYLAAGPLHTGVFNIADMAITTGVIWLLVTWAMTKKQA
jgi:signal peptidase II